MGSNSVAHHGGSSSLTVGSRTQFPWSGRRLDLRRRSATRSSQPTATAITAGTVTSSAARRAGISPGSTTEPDVTAVAAKPEAAVAYAIPTSPPTTHAHGAIGRPE